MNYLFEYLLVHFFVKASNPATGVDFVKLLNTMYPIPDGQHDFMYDHMIPVMQKGLGEIRDLVTTEPRRNYLIDINVSPTPLTETIIWNWAVYYSNLSLKGLESTNFFKKDFPDNSKQFLLFKSYIDKGSKILDK